MKAFVLNARGIGKNNEILMHLESSDITVTEKNQNGEFAPSLTIGISPPNKEDDDFTKRFIVVEKTFFQVLIEKYITKETSNADSDR